MKKKSVFWIVYGILVGLFLVALAGGLLFMDRWTAEYEAAQPENVVKACVVEGLRKGEIPALTTSPYDNAADAQRILTAAVQDKELTVVSAPLTDAAYDAAFTVKAGEMRIAKVYLQRNTEPEPLGTLSYHVAKVVPDSGLCGRVTVVLPKDVTLTVNGVAVSNEGYEDLPLPEIDGTNLPELTNVRSRLVLENLVSSDLDIEAKSASGEQLQVRREGNTYTVEQHISEAEEIQSFALEASHAYAKFLQEDLTKDEMYPYLDTSAAIYKKTRVAHQMRDTNHTGTDFENESVTELYQYAKNVYACHVQFKQVIHKRDKTYTDVFDKTVFVRRKGSEYYVMAVNAADA